MSFEPPRGDHFAEVVILLEDVTDDMAGHFWQALSEHEIELHGCAGSVTSVQPLERPDDDDHD